MIKININESTGEDVAREIFDFINRADQVNKENKTFEDYYEESGFDLQYQYDYIVRLLDETEEIESELYREVQEALIDYELANALDEEEERDEAQSRIDVLEIKLDQFADRHSALLSMYEDIKEEIMY